MERPKRKCMEEAGVEAGTHSVCCVCWLSEVCHPRGFGDSPALPLDLSQDPRRKKICDISRERNGLRPIRSLVSFLALRIRRITPLFDSSSHTPHRATGDG